ncbi:protein phosphatase 2C domain-containing protein [Frankia sp. AgB32]|nr:protein phosphatase 2C domain-containing protein [Frankia sp. AgB32]MCK9893779.1 protein phosphatase 2C domain-containing protein [Frankia sp. AgB32]
MPVNSPIPHPAHPADPAARVIAGERLTLRHAALSDQGLVRPGNQDAVHAGSGVLAVADGFGPAGAEAGAAAVGALRQLDPTAVRPDELLPFLADALTRANQAVRALVGQSAPAISVAREVPYGPIPDLGGSPGPAAGDQSLASHPIGTTLTALLWTGSALAFVHIGDSRAYLLRDGELRQITQDHTLVQAMVEDGRLQPAETSAHPQRMLLLRALDGGPGVLPDLGFREVRRGDRYLLCSDGLSGAVPPAALRRVLTGGAEPERTVHELVALARAAGGADNISCVVADVVVAADPPGRPAT